MIHRGLLYGRWTANQRAVHICPTDSPIHSLTHTHTRAHTEFSWRALQQPGGIWTHNPSSVPPPQPHVRPLLSLLWMMLLWNDVIMGWCHNCHRLAWGRVMQDAVICCVFEGKLFTPCRLTRAHTHSEQNSIPAPPLWANGLVSSHYINIEWSNWHVTR